MNSNKLRGCIAEQRLTIEKTAAAIGISSTALHRKLNGESEFTRDEIMGLANILALSNSDIMAIFFSD